MADDRWIIDTDPSPRLPAYTRLNANDVLADPITPLGASLGWIAHILPGWRDGRRMTRSQEHSWPGRYFKPACRAVADAHADLAYVRGATLYSLRRGAISTRLASGEDEGLVARECATSVQMLRRYYRRDLRRSGRVYANHCELVIAARRMLG